VSSLITKVWSIFSRPYYHSIQSARALRAYSMQYTVVLLSTVALICYMIASVCRMSVRNVLWLNGAY